MTLIGRELTEEIDMLILNRIRLDHQLLKPGVVGAKQTAEAIEVCKRNITDSFLAMDARRGVYADDSKAHERKTQS